MHSLTASFLILVVLRLKELLETFLYSSWSFWILTNLQFKNVCWYHIRQFLFYLFLHLLYGLDQFYTEELTYDAVFREFILDLFWLLLGKMNGVLFKPAENEIDKSFWTDFLLIGLFKHFNIVREYLACIHYSLFV
jgi:hypothetical protein